MAVRPQLSTSWQWWAQLVTVHLMDALGVQAHPSLVQALFMVFPPAKIKVRPKSLTLFLPARRRDMHDFYMPSSAEAKLK